ncbi:MAG: ribosome biogenesis protein [Candidatus Aenigmarchaeota archaeon]|nr:ribosome biogenesis protein [Candidatus Aenigmarchaeota archaeon]
MLKCIKCNRYTLSETCALCKLKTSEVQPPKFSVSDRFGKYRRMARMKNGDNDKGY